MSPRTSEASAHGIKRTRLSGSDVSQPFKSNTNTSSLVPANAVPRSATADHSDSDSSLSESSEEPSDDSSSEDDSEDSDEELQEDQGVVNLRANRGKKPTMKFDKDDLGPDIRPFLQQFLPELKAANDELEAQKRAGTLKTLDAGAGENGEQYIQMEVGLGVLEEKRSDASSSESEDSDAEKNSKAQGILSKLMGHKDTDAMPGIEVVQDEKNT